MSKAVLILNNAHSRQKAAHWANSAPLGTIVEFREPKRTTPQNARMWAMLTDVSIAKPNGLTHTPDMWKSLFMQACGHAVQFLVGLDGMPFPCGHKTSQLSKAQMGELMEFIASWGADNGVKFRDEI